MTDSDRNRPESAADLEARRAAAVRAARSKLPGHRNLLREARHGRNLSAAMLPLFLLRPPRGYGILITTGRKTGKRRRKCMRVIRSGDKAYLTQLLLPHVAVDRPFAASGWLLNIRANPHVRLKIRGGTFSGTVREITEPQELAAARAVLTETVVPLDFGECLLHMRGAPSRTKIQELHRYWFDTGHPLVIDLEV
ncbi:nitroreductase/quinone reductase family protein [Nocardia transvalensis]|uniref:nitroreductase/quinone reductase family protein n=1 Tax=Nocardia transvalensis TaxID=37333 RepID=UPI001895B5C9|nr:nitroreductase/quinone reductase family protein [Nocardia transvalensis]MBF6331142.1 nitroreductase family deazaflavin-dependent oxidoreductase [Nocardia transvalensis]